MDEVEQLDDNIPYDGPAIADVILERARQQQELGYDTSHDDEHSDFSLSRAGACYAMCVNPDINVVRYGMELYPWGGGPNISGGTRTMLVKAAALIIAEIQRLDRLEQCIKNNNT